MKLYQALTQVTINSGLVDDDSDFEITTNLTLPLHQTPDLLYHYIDAVLKPGSHHDENNLKFVTDATFITENFDFAAHDFTLSNKTFDDKLLFAREVVADLNRHLSVNINLETKCFELFFVD